MIQGAALDLPICGDPQDTALPRCGQKKGRGSGSVLLSCPILHCPALSYPTLPFPTLPYPNYPPLA